MIDVHVFVDVVLVGTYAVVLHWLQGNGSYMQFVHDIARYNNTKKSVTCKILRILKEEDIIPKTYQKNGRKVPSG